MTDFIPFLMGALSFAQSRLRQQRRGKEPGCDAEAILVDLGRIFDYMGRDDTLATVAQELHILEKYLKLQQGRFALIGWSIDSGGGLSDGIIERMSLLSPVHRRITAILESEKPCCRITVRPLRERRRRYRYLELRICGGSNERVTLRCHVGYKGRSPAVTAPAYADFSAEI